MFSLTGKTALVTGSRTGMGAAIAVAFARAGADLILHGHHEPPSETAKQVQAMGSSAREWLFDMSEPAAIPDECERLLAESQVDILVNNAGTIRRTPATDMSYSDWRDVLTVNLDAIFLVTQHLGREMVRRGQGKVITIASLLSFQGGINVAGYTASKHAVAGLTRALSNEWAPHNVQVNAIAPGYIETANTTPLRADPGRERAIRERIPAGRWGTPDDITGAAVFLASPASDYVSGHVLVVDGGWLAR